MEIKCNYDSLVDPASLLDHDRNNNKHSDKQIKLLGKLIKYHGFRVPIVVSKLSNKIVFGHARKQASLLMGFEEVPVEYQEFENEADEYRALTADNEVARLSALDVESLISDIKFLGLEDDDFELLGMDDFELPIDPDEAKDAIEDDVPTDVETRCKPGDLWILGEHRLLCGDSTNVQHVERLMGGEKADMVFTDPPYGMGLDTDYSKMGKSGQQHNQGLVDVFNPEMIQVINGFFSYCNEVFLFGADYYSEHLIDKNKGSFIVWDKRSNGDEHIGSLDGAFGSDFELCWSKYKHKRQIARVLRQTGVFANRSGETIQHPTQKPIKLCEWFFDKWGKDHKKIVDLYGGSGSTLIACEKTKRKCYMMELDPHYCDVILSRWEKYSGKSAERVDESLSIKE